MSRFIHNSLAISVFIVLPSRWVNLRRMRLGHLWLLVLATCCLLVKVASEAESTQPFTSAQRIASRNVFGYDPKDQLMSAHAGVRTGREVVASMRCLNCHKGGGGDISADRAMPERREVAQTNVHADSIAHGGSC